jgi:hypothetical protein
MAAGSEPTDDDKSAPSHSDSPPSESPPRGWETQGGAALVAPRRGFSVREEITPLGPLNDQAIALPPSIARGGGSGRGDIFSATVTVTPSEGQQAAFDAMQARVRELETIVRALAPEHDRLSIGGNFPPEPLDAAQPLTPTEWTEFRRLIGVLQAQAVLPQSRPNEAVEAEDWFRDTFIGRRVEEFASEVTKTAAQQLVTAGTGSLWVLAIYGLNGFYSLAHKAIEVADAVAAWVQTLGYPH